MIYEIEACIKPRCFNRPFLFKKEVAQRVGVSEKEISHIEVLKKSVDARSRYPMFRMQMKIYTRPDTYQEPFRNVALPAVLKGKAVVICGSGPAGLFAAYTLAQSGHRPILLERGKDIHSRKKDVGFLCQNGVVDPESNYCFGEGGAGCFSDGKLYTRSNKRGDVQQILSILVHFGANPSILYEAHPHIGSDYLPGIVERMRQALMLSGGEVHFGTKVTDFIIKEGKCLGVVDQNGKEYKGCGVILACGHSAEDIYEWFYSHHYALSGKDWAMGIRLEHPQEVIDRMQYKAPAGSLELSPAEYGFTRQVGDRGVFSFCMCPGGMIIPSMTHPKRFLVNGMSGSLRASPWANAGIVVTVSQEDAKVYEQEYGPLAGLKLQQSLEEKIFQINQLKAPAQRLTDFLRGKMSDSLVMTSYPLGVYSAPMHEILPSFVSESLRAALADYVKQRPEFLTEEAMIIGLESRTSSPVMIPRDTETFQHTQIKNLYPCGEGAGYAGGITSSAIDGVNCAQKLLWNLKRQIANSMNI